LNRHTNNHESELRTRELLTLNWLVLIKYGLKDRQPILVIENINNPHCRHSDRTIIEDHIRISYAQQNIVIKAGL